MSLDKNTTKLHRSDFLFTLVTNYIGNKLLNLQNVASFATDSYYYIGRLKSMQEK